MMEAAQVTLISNFQKVSLCTYALNGEPHQLRINNVTCQALFLLGVFFFLCSQWKATKLDLGTKNVFLSS